MSVFRPLSETKFINDANLVAYYPLDGNSTDVKGGFNGTDTSVSYVTGKYGQAASFNGSNSKITTPVGDLVGDWTYSTFVKFSRNAPSVLEILFGKITTGSSGRQIELSRSSNGKLNINIPWIKVILESNILILNDTTNWYNITITKSGTTWSLYVNGVFDKSVIDATAQETSTNPLMLGNNNLLSGAYFFQGLIDDIAIFNRSLSASEVNELYQGMTYGEYLGAGSATTKLLLHLNGNSTDSSGNGNNGTATNITYVDGKFGKCASFNGTSSNIRFADGSIHPTTFTCMAWVSPNNNVTGDYVLFSTMRDDSGGGGTQYKGWRFNAFRVSGNYLKIECDMFNGSGTGVGINYTSTVTTDGTLSTMHKVHMTYDGSVIRIYLDGKLVGTSASYSIVYSNTDRPTLGCERRYGETLSYFWVGLCDELVVTEFMTPQQIAKNYAYEKGYYATL